MGDLQSEVRAPLVQAPIAWVARRLLATDPSVQVVMVMGGDGKVLAHERALGYDEDKIPIDEGCSLLYYAPSNGLLFYVRTNRQPMSGEIPSRIEAIVGSPTPAVTK